MILTINKARAIISLLFAVMLFFTTVFIGYFVNENRNVSEGLQEAKEHAKQSEEDYLTFQLQEQELLIETVERIWEDQVTEHPYISFDTRVDYLTSSLDRLMIPAYDSLIIAFYKDGELIYTGYRSEVYQPIIDRVLTLDPHHLRSTLVLNDEDVKFGEGERIFVSNTVLEEGIDQEITVYVMFEETVAYQNMIRGLNIDTINGLIERGSTINNTLFMFMFFVLFMGLIILISLRKLYVDVKHAKCPYYGNKLCKSYVEEETKEVSENEN